MSLKNNKGEDAYYISKSSIGVSVGVGGVGFSPFFFFFFVIFYTNNNFIVDCV